MISRLRKNYCVHEITPVLLTAISSSYSVVSVSETYALIHRIVKIVHVATEFYIPTSFTLFCFVVGRTRDLQLYFSFRNAQSLLRNIFVT